MLLGSTPTLPGTVYGICSTTCRICRNPSFLFLRRQLLLSILISLYSRCLDSAIQFDSPFHFRSTGSFGSGQDLQAQYGGLFYSAASSSMVGAALKYSPPSKPSPLRTSLKSAVVKQRQQQRPLTAPTTPSTALSFNMKQQEDASDSSASFLDPFPSSSTLDDHKGSLVVNGRNLLAPPSPYTSSISSSSHSDDCTFSPISSTQSSPRLHDANNLESDCTSLRMESHPIPSNSKPATNRFFGAHHSQIMHEDSDSPFTTDFSSSEDEAFADK